MANPGLCRRCGIYIRGRLCTARAKGLKLETRKAESGQSSWKGAASPSSPANMLQFCNDHYLYGPKILRAIGLWQCY